MLHKNILLNKYIKIDRLCPVYYLSCLFMHQPDWWNFVSQKYISQNNVWPRIVEDI
jgi:hypothetical protein